MAPMEIGYMEIGILGLAVLGVASIVVGTIRAGISPMPTSRRAQKAMLSLMPENVHGPVYELGSGWGQLACAVAQRLPDARIIGFENSPLPWMVSKILRMVFGAKNLVLQCANFEKKSLSDAGLILCYLYPGAMTTLAERFPKELKPGCVVITNTFRLPGWTPEKTIQLDDLHQTHVYRYVVGEKPEEEPARKGQSQER